MRIEDLAAYEIISRQKIHDLRSEGYLLRHKKSGARIALLSNEDENKVFYIGFKTPPADSTGVAHILEHSVLEGSKEFPVKDPFIELVKGSMNTFLNAMTYPDKTMYPVASCNDKDFANLMHGYMDEINKLTKNNSKYLSGGGTNVEMDGVQACAYARIRYTTGDDYKRTERQRTVLTAMVQKAQKANLTTINSLIDELFGDIKTSFSNTELISLAAKVFNYSLGETIGFPFEKNTTTLGNKGSVVVPCDLESNVKQLHVFLYDDNEYAPTDTVKNNSAQIVNDTGFHQGEGY